MENILLETLLDLSQPVYATNYYQRDPSPSAQGLIFQINAVNGRMKPEEHTNDFGYKEYGLLLKNSYVLHMQHSLKLPRRESRPPTPIHTGNWMSSQELGPVYFEFDLDLDKSYLEIRVQPKQLRNEVIKETERFMKLAGIPKNLPALSEPV